VAALLERLADGSHRRAGLRRINAVQDNDLLARAEDVIGLTAARDE
jgi:hypothetical protein